MFTAPSDFFCLVIGGGPAGLACGLYLARLRCTVGVISRQDQRVRLIECTWNQLGYPEGVNGSEFLEHSREQAARYGVRLIDGEVVAAARDDGRFRLRLSDGREYGSQFLVFATGVEDISPNIPDVERYVGCGLRHCPVCDAYEAIGARLALFGSGEEVVRHALFLRRFTDRITILFNGAGSWKDLPPESRAKLLRRGIRGEDSPVVAVLDHDREIRGFELANGSVLAVDRAYSALGVRPRTELAASLGVELDETGFIKVDAQGRTNVAGVYAAGDVVNADYAQIAIAIGQGATVAIHMHLQGAVED